MIDISNVSSDIKNNLYSNDLPLKGMLVNGQTTEAIIDLLQAKVNEARYCLGLYSSPHEPKESADGIAALIEANNRASIANANSNNPNPTNTTNPINTTNIGIGSTSGDQPWIKVAKTQVGVNDAGSVNGQVSQYLQVVGIDRTGGDHVPWCSAFANWVMKQVGIRGSMDARAISWQNWGQAVAPGTIGCIAVQPHHVAFYLGTNNGKATLLGGNQSNSVDIGSYTNPNRIIAWRWPS